VATLSLQYTFPDGFSWLVWQFSRTGYMAGIPSFICLAAIITIYFKLLGERLLFWAVIIMLCSPLILTQAVSQKDDIAVATFFLAGLVSIVRLDVSRSLPISIFMASLCIGTKWTGIPAAVLILCTQLAYVLISAINNNNKLQIGLLRLTLITPFLFFSSSFQTYFENYKNYGTITPVLDDMAQSVSGGGMWLGLRDLFFHIFSNMLDVFKLPVYVIRMSSGFADFNLRNVVSPVIYIWDGFYTSHSPMGIAFMLIIIGTLTFLFERKKFSFEITIITIVSFVYIAVTMCFTQISGGKLRYLLPAFMTLIPASALGLSIIFSTRIWIHVFCVLSIVISFSVILLNNDRTIPQPFEKTKGSFLIYAHDHDLLMFLGLPGYINFFENFKKIVTLDQSLLILDNSTQDDISAAEIPHFLPFLTKRSPANTSIMRKRYDDISRFTDFRFILVYTRRGEALVFPNYERLIDTGWPALILYKKVNPRN